MRILVAGVREGSAALILPFLAKKGHALFLALSGEELVQHTKTQAPDLMIIDLDLPTKNRLGTLEELERELEAISIPVIVIAEGEYLKPRLREFANFLRRNTVAVFDKPVDLGQLEKEIARIYDEEVQEAGCLTGETLSQLADGELREEEAERAQRHLSQCWVCQRQYEESQKTNSFLKDFFRTAMRARMKPSKQCLSSEKLVAYFRDRLSAEERAEVEAHLAECSYCIRELAALYSLVKELDREEPAPLSEEILNRLKGNVIELLRKSASLICIRCFESIPLGSTTCPHCGAVVRGKVQGENVSGPEEIADKRDHSLEPEARENCDCAEEITRRHPNPRFRGTRKVQVAASLLGLALVASAVFAGFAVYRNHRIGVSRRATLAKPGEESALVTRLEDSVEEKIEVFGRIAMFEVEFPRFEVPENVDRIARTLIRQYYYDESIVQQALHHEDIWDVFAMLNRMETKGSKSAFVPKPSNRVLGPDEVLALERELSGEYVGIGVAVRLDPEGNGEVIIGFGANSPAKEAGLQVGDIITEVDGKSLYGLDFAQTTTLHLGPVGTKARLKVAREGVPDFEIWVPRQGFEMSTVQRSFVGTNAAYVKVLSPTEGAVEDLAEVLTELTRSDVRQLVLDLRGNIGSSLQAAVDVASLFLPEGTLVARTDQTKSQSRIYAEGRSIWEGPLAVLVDNYTMSGAELVAAALKGAGRAVIIGQRTAGKGSVQTVYRITSDYALQVTTAVLTGPNGLVFNNCGLQPDVEVAGTGTYFLHSEETPSRLVKLALDSLEQASVTSEKEADSQ